MLETEIAFAKKYEKLLIAGGVLLLLLFLGNKLINVWADHTHKAAGASEQKLADDTGSNAQLAKSIADLTTATTKLMAQLSQQNAQLTQQMTARSSQTGRQQGVDQTLPLPALGQRWATLVGLDQKMFSASAIGITASEPAARATVVELEKVPELTQNLGDSQTIVKNTNQQLQAQIGLNAKLNEQITGLNKTVFDANENTKKQVADTKAQARKAKRGWFIVGTVVGGVGTAYLESKVRH